MKKKPRTCAVVWCAALPQRGTRYCAVHRREQAFKPDALSVADKCLGCDGLGCHHCGWTGLGGLLRGVKATT